jgi:hypothetical protein
VDEDLYYLKVGHTITKVLRTIWNVKKNHTRTDDQSVGGGETLVSRLFNLVNGGINIYIRAQTPYPGVTVCFFWNFWII